VVLRKKSVKTVAKKDIFAGGGNNGRMRKTPLLG
jgi:hypothetical protein